MSSSALIGSTLYYSRGQIAELSDLSDAVTQAFADIRIRARLKFASAADLVFEIGGLTLTIARTETPLADDRLKHVNRPDPAHLDHQTICELFENHHQAVVIQVSGPQPAAQQKTRLAICYIATVQLLGLAPADLIHWAKSDTLYSLDEFCCKSDTKIESDIAPKPRALAATGTSTPRPMIPMAWRSSCEREHHRLTHEALRNEKLRNEVFSASQTQETDHPVRSILEKPILHGAAIGLAIQLQLSIAFAQQISAVKIG